jgi:hypothetical protein
MVGAQTIISGAVSKVGPLYRLRMRAINVETATIQGQFNRNIPNGPTITALADGSASYGTSSEVPRGSAGNYGNATASDNAGQTAANSGEQTATPATPADPASGTYTFWPRPQATKAGVGIDAYLVKIVVRGNYFIVYMDRVARGMTDSRAMPGYWYLRDNVLLTDLDHPARTWHPVNHAENNGIDGEVLSFEKVTGTRFSLECSWYGQNIFEEITLDKPDT